MLELNKIHLGDSYELIKQIPDKSIDCIYVDVPYLYTTGGTGSSELAKRATINKMELMGQGGKFNPNIKLSENLRIANNHKNAKQGLKDITSGIDYKQFIKEAFRVMRKTNIYIYG